METLVTEAPDEYEVETAADLVMELLGSRLHNAPAVDEISESRWRS
jgi:hypothetical protein